MDVRRSVREPAFDADVNVLGTVRHLENCVEHGVGKVVFASSGGAIYGEQEEFSAPEAHPQYPFSPYGVSKLACERYLNYYRIQYGISYAALLKRLRPQAGPARRSGGGGDLLRQPGGGQEVHDKRHRRADP
jgi:nucleoside-diphosphate-sugar epimerase